jgi:hypothetical protein
MTRPYEAEELLALIRGFQSSCVVIAAAELDVFSRLLEQPSDGIHLAARLHSDPRATTILLDALAAMDLLSKAGGIYSVPPTVAAVLSESGDSSVLGMARHQGNCLRRWSQLAQVVSTGKPWDEAGSVRGAAEDTASFIRAMHEISGRIAPGIIKSLGPLEFSHLLDLGGASGTWTIPFLQMNPAAVATIFDLPEVIPMAAKLAQDPKWTGRIRLVAGDFYADDLPPGADLAWVSAIVHQNSREQNRMMFSKLLAALVPGGQILIRDIVMDESRTRPAAGAFFAVNMLVGTDGGGTFTFDELKEDLTSAGFVNVRQLRRGEAMDSIVGGVKPAGARPQK